MKTILVADDSRELAEMAAATLEEAGYEVSTAYSGLAAVACLEQQAFDAVVLDVLMPGLSGDAVADRIRRVSPHLPVLLMSGDAGGEFAAASGLPLLRKPFSPDALVAAVALLLA
ncbi:MAG: response regulator transcription factor [Gaiellaceae bacterium]